MGKGKAKFNKSVNTKAKKSKSEISSRQRWTGGEEPVHRLRNKDVYSVRNDRIEEIVKKKHKQKKKDKSQKLKTEGSTGQPRNKKEKKTKAKKAALLHPVANASLDRASPWLEGQDAAFNRTNDNTEQRPLKRPRPMAGLPTVALRTELLDQELLAFAAYVQLTLEEQAAREALVQSLQEVAAKQQQEVRVFGSFATPQVCVFMSDIDIALWGAIPDPPTVIKAPPAPTPAQLEEERKRKLLEKWNLALAQVDAANETVPDTMRHASVGSFQEAFSTTKSTDEDASPSFVIDRVGSVAESAKVVAETTSSTQSPTAAAHKISFSRDSYHDSDDDSADKMESYQRSSLTTSKAPEPSYARYISLSSESSDDESVLEEGVDKKTNNMQVSFFNDPQVRTGPTGRIRNKVLDALGTFRQDIRCMNSKWIRKVTFITKARVPILKMDTALGVEVDVAIGGHNGTDTSQFAAKQSELYKSFATVVLFLKALLHQNRLDVPFTGGLGSYKLYVLVAFHIEQHLLAGGRDEPGEVLISFFFRFGDIHGFNHVSPKCRTRLRQHEPLHYKEDTVADLSNVFNLSNVLSLFRRSWQVLSAATKKNNSASPMLRHLIDGHQIRVERSLCQSRTTQVSKQLLPLKRQSDHDTSAPMAKRLRFS